MLALNFSLLFPRFSPQGEVSFKSWSDSQKTTDTYKLDWDTIDNIKKERYNRNINKESPYPGTLPELYDNWVKNMIFAIPNTYKAEIRRCTHLALLEWGTNRPFDTMIREICLEPAISYIYVSFRLIADCLYDKEANYFYRGEDKAYATQAMLYKFWSFQTGSGLIKKHARFENLNHENNIVQDFLEVINKYEETNLKLKEELPVIGPSLV